GRGEEPNHRQEGVHSRERHRRRSSMGSRATRSFTEARSTAHDTLSIAPGNLRRGPVGPLRLDPGRALGRKPAARRTSAVVLEHHARGRYWNAAVENEPLLARSIASLRRLSRRGTLGFAPNASRADRAATDAARQQDRT